MPAGDQPLAPAAGHRSAHESGAKPDGSDSQHRRLARREHGRGPSEGNRSGTSTSGGNTPEVRTKARAPWRVAGVRRPEDRRSTGRHTRIDGAADLAGELDVDGSVRQLRIEAADEVAPWTRELEVDVRARQLQRGRHDDPRPGDAHAHLEASALVCRVRSGSAGRGKRARQYEQGSEPHGTLRNQSADNAPPKSRKAAEPPAKKSPISLVSLRRPSREPSFS